MFPPLNNKALVRVISLQTLKKQFSRNEKTQITVSCVHVPRFLLPMRLRTGFIVLDIKFNSVLLSQKAEIDRRTRMELAHFSRTSDLSDRHSADLATIRNV